jgi:hypothetical protein
MSGINMYIKNLSRRRRDKLTEGLDVERKNDQESLKIDSGQLLTNYIANIKLEFVGILDSQES